MMDQRATIEHLMTVLRAVLAPVVIDAYRAAFGKRYLNQIEKALKSDRYEPHFEDEDALAQIDVMGWLNLIMRRWEEVFKTAYFTDCRSYVGELTQARHRWAHQGDFSDEDVYRILDTALRLLRTFELTDAANQIAPLRLAWLARLQAGLPPSPPSEGRPKPSLAPPIVPPPKINDTDASIDVQIAALAAAWTKVELRAEVVRLLRTISLDDDLPLTVAVAPRSPELMGLSEARLIILPPEGAHRPDARTIEESAAFKFAVKWVAAHPASKTAFLAMDIKGAVAVGDAVRQWLAVVQYAHRNPKPPPSTKSALDLRRQAAYEAVGTALQAAYRWLIVMGEDGTFAVELDDDAPLIEPAARAAAFYLAAER